MIERALDDTEAGFIFVNVIEFDQTWGHRNDVPGFHEGLQQLDAWIPRLEARIKGDDLIILTADHGNDPTTPSRSEEHTSELQSQSNLVCRLLLEKKKRSVSACARDSPVSIQ